MGDILKLELLIDLRTWLIESGTENFLEQEIHWWVFIKRKELLGFGLERLAFIMNA